MSVIGRGIGIGFGTGKHWGQHFYILSSGPIRYRREINRSLGTFKLDYSEDSGVTWENLATLDLTEPAVVIDLAHIYHHRIVDYEYRVDNFLTALGYAGVEGVDWENLYTAGGWVQEFKNTFTGIPTLYTGNPLMTNTGPFRCMVLVNGVYHLFEEVLKGDTPIWYIRKRTSVDGFAFSNFSAALFSGGAAGSYDENGQADPTVIYDGVGDWKMWFDAKKIAAPDGWSAIGYATSSDGDTWVNQGAVLQRGGAGTWDADSIHHPVCIKHNGVYYLYYAGAETGNANGVHHIGLATSPDGINWTKSLLNPVISAGGVGDWDETYIRPSNPILIYGTWYMWYWGYNGTVHSMGLATSPDLINWTKQGRVLEGTVSSSNNISASNGILSIGTNPLDRLVKMWFTSLGNSLFYAKIVIHNLLTKLSMFVKAPLVKYGDTVVGAQDTYAQDYIYFHRVTVGADITAEGLRMYINTIYNPAKFIKLALYSNNVNTPDVLLATTQEKTYANVTSTAWNDFKFLVNPVLPAADYWIAVFSSDYYDAGKAAGGANNFGNLSQAYGAFPNPVVATTNQGFSGCDIFLFNRKTVVYDKILVVEPTNVYFNNILGNKVASEVDVDSEYDWFWSDGLLKIYSSELADLKYEITYE